MKPLNSSFIGFNRISKTEIIDIKKSMRISLVPFGESIAFARAIEKILVERITNHCVDAISSLEYGSDDEWDRAIRATMYAMTVLKNLTIPVSEEWGNPR